MQIQFNSQFQSLLKRFSYLLPLIVIFSFSRLNAGLPEAWEAFKNNELDAAETEFKEIVAQGDKDAFQAALALNNIYSERNDYQAGLNNIRNIIKYSPEITPYFYSLIQFLMAQNFINIDVENDILEEMLDSKKINETIKAHIYELISRNKVKVYDYKAAKKIWEKIGQIKSWAIAGPFDNTSRSGFNKNYPPIANPESDAVFINRNRAKIEWQDFTVEKPATWHNLKDKYPVYNSIFFAQTFCKSDKEQKVQLRIGTSGSLKAWVNDALVFEEADERNNGIDTYIAEIQLHKGWNRLLIQIGSSDIEECNFLARITDDDGRLIDDIEFSTKMEKYKKAAKTKLNPKENRIEKFFLDEIQKNPDNLANYLCLADMYFWLGDLENARITYEKALVIAPGCGIILSKLYFTLDVDNKETQKNMVLDQIKQADPDNMNALAVDFEEEIDKKDYDKVQSIIERMQRRSRNKITLSGYELQLASAQSKFELINQIIDGLYNEMPQNETIVYQKMYVERNFKRNNTEAANVLSKYVKNFNSLNMIYQLANLYFELGQEENGFKEMSRLLEYEPNNDVVLSQIGNKHFAQREYTKALEYFLKCIKISPYNLNNVLNVAVAYDENEQDSEAIPYYKRYIELNPFDYKVRDKLLKLEKQTSPVDLVENPDYYSIFAQAPDASQYPNDNAAILYYSTTRGIISGAVSESRRIMLVKIFTSKGIDELKEYSIDDIGNTTIEKAEVLKKDGRRLKAEVNGLTAVFTNLDIGDGILLISKSQHYKTMMLGDYFWDSHYFEFMYPCLTNKYTLIVPPSEKFDYKTENFDLKPVISDTAGYKKYTWGKGATPALRNEAYTPAYVDCAATLHVSSIPDWNTVSTWYNDVSLALARPDYDTRKLLDSLFSDGQELSEMETAKKIYNYIVTKIRYSSIPFRQSGLVPQLASDVIVTQMGDCKDVSTLFATLCRLKGIDARLVLISTRDNGSKSMPLPSIDFDHCIAMIKINNKKYYIELTSDSNPFGTIAFALKNAIALEIGDNIGSKTFLMNPDTRLKNSTERETKVTIKGNQMFVESNSVKYGSAAVVMRSTYQNVAEEEQRSTIIGIISRDLPRARLLDLKFDETLNNTADSVHYNYSFTVDNCFSKITSLHALKIPISDALTSFQPLANDDRKYPVVLYYNLIEDYLKERVEIELPENYTLLEIPANTDKKSKYIDYSLHFKQEGNKLVINRLLTVKNDIVGIEDFFEFRQLWEDIIQDDTQQLAFKEKTNDKGNKSSKKGKTKK
jgi:tetratricopeptide (TPR) repeat protein